jgi:hypothetical protein
MNKGVANFILFFVSCPVLSCGSHGALPVVEKLTASSKPIDQRFSARIQVFFQNLCPDALMSLDLAVKEINIGNSVPADIPR